MSGTNQEFYHPQVVAAATATKIGTRLHGILASAAGTVTLVNAAGITLLNAMPIVAGYNKIAIYSGTDGMVVTSSVAACLLT